MENENGQPSEDELQALLDFEGTPREFVEYLGSIWRYGAGWTLEQVPHEHVRDRTEWVAKFITGGWSGCEMAQSTVARTVFGWRFYAAWKRGGYHEYRIDGEHMDAAMFLGDKDVLVAKVRSERDNKL